MKKKNTIVNEVSETNDVAITHDSWTSVATDNFETVTCHYINANWALESVVLQTTKITGPHNAANIAKFLTGVKTVWKLPNIIAVSDNASVEVKTFSDLGWPRLGCMGHTLNLVVRGALKEPTLTLLIGKGRSLVSYFHHSPLATNYLEDKQKLLVTDEVVRTYKLINDVPTRWNSTLDMLTRLTQLIQPLNAVAHDPTIKIKDLRGLLYDHDELKIIEGLITTLGPFKKATEMLSSETTPTLSMVIPTLKILNKTLAIEETQNEGDATEDVEGPEVTPDFVKELKKTMKKELNSRTEKDIHIYQLASALDPRSKAMILNDVPEMKDRLLEAITKNKVKVKEEPAVEVPPMPTLPMLPESLPIKREPGTPQRLPPSKKAKKDDDDDDWYHDVLVVKVEGPDPDYLKKEVDRYFSDPFDRQTHNVLTWWAEREPIYPNIAPLARKYLCTPASSVPSERFFSLAGNLVSKKRACLKDSNVDMLIFLKKIQRTNNQYWIPLIWIREISVDFL